MPPAVTWEPPLPLPLFWLRAPPGPDVPLWLGDNEPVPDAAPFAVPVPVVESPVVPVPDEPEPLSPDPPAPLFEEPSFDEPDPPLPEPELPSFELPPFVPVCSDPEPDPVVLLGSPGCPLLDPLFVPSCADPEPEPVVPLKPAPPEPPEPPEPPRVELVRPEPPVNVPFTPAPAPAPTAPLLPAPLVELSPVRGCSGRPEGCATPEGWRGRRAPFAVPFVSPGRADGVAAGLGTVATLKVLDVPMRGAREDKVEDSPVTLVGGKGARPPAAPFATPAEGAGTRVTKPPAPPPTDAVGVPTDAAGTATDGTTADAEGTATFVEPGRGTIFAPA